MGVRSCFLAFFTLWHPAPSILPSSTSRLRLFDRHFARLGESFVCDKKRKTQGGSIPRRCGPGPTHPGTPPTPDGRLYFIDRDQDRPPDAFTVVLGWRALLDSRAAARDRAVLR